MKEKIEMLLIKQSKKKKDLIKVLGLAHSTFFYKHSNSSWNKEELKVIEDFFDGESLTNQLNSTTSLAFIEKSLKHLIQENLGDLLKEQKDIIDQQKFIISTMRVQLEQALGKALPSELLPVTLLDSKVKKLDSKVVPLPSTNTNYGQAS